MDYSAIGKLRTCAIPFLLFAAVIMSSIAAWAIPDIQSKDSATDSGTARTVVFSSSTSVISFWSAAGQWTLATFGRADAGSEFYVNNQPFREVDSEKAQLVLNVAAGTLVEAD